MDARPPDTLDAVDQVLADVEVFAAEVRKSPVTVSDRALGNSRGLQVMRRQRDALRRKIKALQDFMRDQRTGCPALEKSTDDGDTTDMGQCAGSRKP